MSETDRSDILMEVENDDISDLSKILRFNAAGSTIRTNPCMAAAIGTPATDVYYALLSKYKYYMTNMRDALIDGAFPCSRLDLMESVPYKKDTPNRALNALTLNSIITVKGTSDRYIKFNPGYEIIAEQIIYSGIRGLSQKLPPDIFSKIYGGYDISRPESDTDHVSVIAAAISEGHTLTTNRALAHFIGLDNARLYNVLLSLASTSHSEDGLVSLDLSYLSGRIGVSVSSISRALSELEEYMLIKLWRRKRSGTYIMLRHTSLIRAFLSAAENGILISRRIKSLKSYSENDINNYISSLRQSYMESISALAVDLDVSPFSTIESIKICTTPVGENSGYTSNMDTKKSNCDTNNSNCDTKNSDCDANNSNCDASNSDCDANNSNCDTSNSDCDANNSNCDANNSDCDVIPYNNIKEHYSNIKESLIKLSPTLTNTPLVTVVDKQGNERSLTQIFSEVKETLTKNYKTISRVGYEQWIEPLKVLSFESNAVTLCANNEFNARTAREQYGEYIKDCFEQILGISSVDVLFTCEEDVADTSEDCGYPEFASFISERLAEAEKILSDRNVNVPKDLLKQIARSMKFGLSNSKVRFDGKAITGTEYTTFVFSRNTSQFANIIMNCMITDFSSIKNVTMYIVSIIMHSNDKENFDELTCNSLIFSQQYRRLTSH